MSDKTLIRETLEQKRGLSPGNNAFTQIVRKYQDLVFGYVYSQCRDHFLSQDITQEVFIIAYNKLHTLNNPAVFSSWIRQIARHECIRVRKKTDPLHLPPEQFDQHVSEYAEPDISYEREESLSEIQQSIDTLPEQQRVPLVLYYIDGYSQKDIAHFLDIKLNTIKKRLQRGRENLKKDIMSKVKASLKSLRPSNTDTLVDRINLYTLFDMTAKSGQFDLLEQMLVDGAGIDTVDNRGHSFLHWAVDSNHLEAIRLLLKYGADTNAKDKNGKSAYQLAHEKNNPHILALFEDPDRLT